MNRTVRYRHSWKYTNRWKKCVVMMEWNILWTLLRYISSDTHYAMKFQMYCAVKVEIDLVRWTRVYAMDNPENSEVKMRSVMNFWKIRLRYNTMSHRVFILIILIISGMKALIKVNHRSRHQQTLMNYEHAWMVTAHVFVE